MEPRYFGSYQLLETLGEGGMGAADLARQVEPALGMPALVVVKRLHEQLAANEVAMKRFQHEAQLAVHIDSPHVAKVYDAGMVQTTLYIAMEYVAGSSGQDLIIEMHAKRRRIPIGVAIEIGCQLLEGLEAIHDAIDSGFRPLEAVHRDVSPKNYMIGSDGIVRIIDLGLGKSKARDWQTAQGRVMGTPGYLAPEQAMGLPADRRADLYAAGVILYELLTLTRYIPVGPVFGMLQATRERTFVPPSSIREDLPPALDPVLLAVLDPEPGNRPSTAKDLRTVLEGIHPRDGSFALRSFVEDLVGSAWEERRLRVRDLVDSVSTDDDPSMEPTVIFARRSTPPVVSTQPDAIPTVTRPPHSRFPRAVAGVVVLGGLLAALALWPNTAPRDDHAAAEPQAVPWIRPLSVDSGPAVVEREVVERFDSQPGRKTTPANGLPPAAEREHSPPEPIDAGGLSNRISALLALHPNEVDVMRLQAEMAMETQNVEMTEKKRSKLAEIQLALEGLESRLRTKRSDER